MKGDSSVWSGLGLGQLGFLTSLRDGIDRPRLLHRKVLNMC